MHLADLTSYLDADRRLVELYASPEEWTRKAILNVAGSGKFSSDRTIAQYAREVWDAKPCPLVNGECTLFGSASYGSKPCPLSRLNPDQFIGAFERSR